MKSEKKLFLLDAFALIYRAYFAFAKNPRINSKGLDTSAVFGFVNTLNEVIKKEKPSHIAVVFDRKKPTQRHVDYPEYKAHREAMPDGLRDALPYIDTLLEAFNIPKLYMDGYEADDVIGTLAKKAEQEGFQTYMMTSDKDFAQLVSENIFMYRPGNKWQPTAVWGIPEVLEKFDIQRVDQVIDYLGMMGDTADNIPGIPGIGKKTAQKFLKQYGSMEGLFANSQELKGKMKEKVELSEEIGLLCKKLVTIITDVPIEFDADAMLMEPKNEEKIISLFEELEFKTILPRILGSSAKPNKPTEQVEKKTIEKLPAAEPTAQFDLFSQPTSVPAKIEKTNFELITDPDKLSQLKSEIENEGKFSFQIITDTKEALTTKIVGFSLSHTNDNGFYIPFNKDTKGLIKSLFENVAIDKLGYDLKFAIKVLSSEEIEVLGTLFDIEIAHYLLHPDMRHALDVISDNYLNKIMIDEQSVVGKGKTKVKLSSLNSELITDFAAEQASIIFNLAAIFEKELKEVGVWNLFTDVEIPLTVVLAKIENEGIALDVEMLNKYSIELTNELELQTKKIHDFAGEEFNIASPKQMGEILFSKMELSKKPKKTKSGQFSTSEETLAKLKDSHPIIEEILNFRAVKKLLSTYVDALPEIVNSTTKRIHTTFNQSVAATGRLSSVNPNLQNIPIRTKRGMKVREAFIPRDKNYTLMAADYSQIELRIMASLSKDEGMLTAFNNGVDIHSATAAKVYKVPVEDVDREMRSKAKAVNFGIIYGISAFGLSQNIGVSRTEAKEIIDNYFEQFPKVKEYMDWSIEQAREKEYVETVMGRRRYLNDINSRNAVMRSVAERNAINAPIQGSAADIVKKAMIDVQVEMDKRGMQSKMLLQVHDELVFDMHNSESEELKSLVKEKMEQAVTLKVPLIVDIGEGVNWLEAH
ncbi:MAG: DNA polymerase I [Flavobacteriales bacterium]|nr:DNA polymerase I [Flavobacteriales bacterium]